MPDVLAARSTIADAGQDPRPTVEITSSGLPYRADIDGLRAIAVVLVVMYHAGISWFGGGYVGVDVFFVISGYLITSALVRQGETGRVRLLAFYAGRMRRLLPMATLTIVVTSCFGLWLLSVSRAGELLGDARSALLYVSNWRFADKSVAYVDTDVSDGMLTHFWSLSIEEQFYFGWPLMIALSTLVVRVVPRVSFRQIVGVLAATVVVVSLFASIRLTPEEGARAYYLTHLRLWEIAAGALVAVSARRFWPQSGRSELLRTLAIGAIVVVAVAYGDATPFPGSAAIVPVAATVLLIGLGGRQRSLDRVLGSTPMRYIGERSYALYLWHWPALGVVALIADRYEWDLPEWFSVAVAVAAASALSVVSHRLVENPIRHAPRFKPRTGWTIAVGAACTLLLVLSVAPVRDRNLAAAAKDWSDVPVTPSQAVEDTVSTLYRSCHQLIAASFEPFDWCELGDPAGSTTIALVGDSHAQHWAPAFDAAGKSNGWRVLLATRSGCIPYEVPIYALRVERMDEGCLAWGEAVRTSLMGNEHVDLFLVGRARGYIQAVRAADGTEVDRRVASSMIASAVTGFAAAIEGFSDRILILQDTPTAPEHIPECLDRTGPARADECDFPVTVTELEVELIAAEQAGIGATSPGRTEILSLNDLVCPGGTCRALLRDGTITFRDHSHMTAAFSRSLADGVADALQQYLAD